MWSGSHKAVWSFAVFLFVSCASPQESAVLLPIEASWPCFNGCDIVLQGGKYGLVANDGTQILPAEYDSIEFLDNDVALISRDGLYGLCTRKGRILSREGDEASLRGNWPAILEESLEADRKSWEQVLQDYERLCRQCRASRGKRLSRKELARLQVLQSQVLVSLQEAQGVPTASQKARLEEMSAEYRRAF